MSVSGHVRVEYTLYMCAALLLIYFNTVPFFSAQMSMNTQAGSPTMPSHASYEIVWSCAPVIL